MASPSPARPSPSPDKSRIGINSRQELENKPRRWDSFSFQLKLELELELDGTGLGPVRVSQVSAIHSTANQVASVWCRCSLVGFGRLQTSRHRVQGPGTGTLSLARYIVRTWWTVPQPLQCVRACAGLRCLCPGIPLQQHHHQTCASRYWPRY